METKPKGSGTTGHSSQVMSKMKDTCCCCFELQSFKNLWSEYEWMGRCEVYGQMLMDCFNLNLEQNKMSNDQICEVCITHLRNAVQFKQRVIESQVKLQERLTSVEDTKVVTIKEETNDFGDYDIDTDAESTVPIEFKPLELFAEVGETCPESPKSPKTKRKKPPAEKKPVLIKRPESPKSPKTKRKKPPAEKEPVLIKRPESPKSPKTKRKKPPAEKEPVLIKRMKKITITPQNTEDNEKSEKITFHNTSYVKPRQNAALILEHSTIVPFRCKKSYFMCLYCSKHHVGFDELKSHTIQSHNNVTFQTIIKSINRPRDRIRADCSDITCKICKNKIQDLEKFVSHLRETHNIKFNDDVKPIDSILPHEMCDGKFKCYECKSEFLFFTTLTNHMNTHSKDHVCEVCGRCFLLPGRLKAHLKLHSEKEAKCNICDKMCTSYFALQAHIRVKHNNLQYMCVLCNIPFASYRLRSTHMEEVHKRAPLNLICKICSKQYYLPQSLNSHMRVKHLKGIKERVDRKHDCAVCGQSFKTASALTSHALVHSGEKKFECNVCHKKYPRAKALREHLKIHRNDKRWNCGLCFQAFVQKCSLRNHIRVHHPSMDSETLIVYKKPEKEQ